MKAALLNAYGDTDQFSYGDVPTPTAGAGEVLVKVEASSFNPVDLYIRQGYLAERMPIEMPAILGLDLAGTVESVGPGVTDYKPGDRVVSKLPIQGPGSHAEYAVAKAEHLAHLPDNLSFEAGATLPLAGLTGRQAVDALGEIKGKRVLVTGALGAVGRATVQYLKERGAIPVAGVRASRVAEAKALGLEAIDIDAPGEPTFDAAVANVGGPTAAAAIALVRDGGALTAVAGVPEGANADNRITVTNILAVENAAMLQATVDAAGRGDLVIPIAHTFRLSELGEGHKRAAAGQVGGKIIFVP